MDQQQERAKDDLRGLVKGEVLADPVALQLYASDASIYQIRPLVVVRPRSLADVVQCVKYARENHLPLHPRGAGTGLAGESLGGGIVLDFARHMRRIVHADAATVCVQPGVIHARLNEFLRPHGRHFGPDPSTSSVTTMGGVLAVDSSGSHWLRYGSPRHHVRRLQVVLGDGEVLEVGREPIPDLTTPATNRRDQLVGQLAALLRSERELIEQHQPKSVVNRFGYQLADVLNNGDLQLAKLLCGSEGTLAIVTEATLATQPLPRHRGVALLMFERLEYAAKAVMEVLQFSPSACDLMDRRHLSLARGNIVHFDLLIPAETEAALLIEQEGESPIEVRQRLAQVVERVRRRRRWAFHAVQTQDRAEVDLFWMLARNVVPTLYRMKGVTRPVPFVEDVAVPPRALPDFLLRLQNVLKQHQVTASLFAHAGHGQLHLRPFLDLSNPADVQSMARLAPDLYREVLDVGGTISGEHADGLSRTAYLRMQYGALVDVFRRIKEIFDPLGILNPGKKLNDDPDLLIKNLRPTITAVADQRGAGPLADKPPEEPAADPLAAGGPPAVELLLNWNVEDVADMARSCNGCGACRSQLGDVRMCPIFRGAPAEEASPRAKANLVRAVMLGQLPVAALTDDDFKDVADLCVHCQMCRLECPASVDIPRLMAEAKGNYVRTNGLRAADWCMANVDRLAALGSALSPLANWALGSRSGRWLLEKLLGVAQGRKIPRFAARHFLRVAVRRRLTRPTRRSGHKVLYFVDTFVNYHDPQLGEALVAVLEHNGVAVYVHPDQKSSGMPMIALGALAQARQVAAHNVSLLAEAVRLGYHILATEPSAVLCLTHEYRHLLSDDDARLVAENTSEACAYLWKLHQQGKLQLDFRPVHASLGYHLPCHVKALGCGTPGESLLRLVPGLVVRPLDCGCSGMAGTFGLQRKNYRTSLRAGWGLISALRDSRLHAGATECSACRIQMEQGAAKPTLHPIKVLALAYGLGPDPAGLLVAGGEERMYP